MKVALISWAPFFAGAEMAGLRLALGLREAGHEVVCAVGTDGELLARLRQEQIEAVHIPTRFTDKWKWWSYRTSRGELRQWLRREQPDIVHSNDLPTHQMASDAARGLGLPRVCHHRWIFDRGAIGWFNKFGAERHLFVSQSLRDELYNNSPRLAASPGEVVYDGLPLPRCPAEDDRIEAKRELGLSADRLLAVFAGQIIERKGVADLLAAWDQLAALWSELAELVIVGDDLEGKGAYRRQMETFASERSLPVRFAGFQRDVYRWYTAADLVIFPSTNEPLGLIALEGMAHARPVIGTAVGGIRETIVPEETGLLVPARSPENLARGMERLLADAGLRTQLGTAGRQRCEALFSLESHVAAVVKQYEAVLADEGVLA